MADSPFPVYHKGFLYPSCAGRTAEDVGCYMYISAVEPPPPEVIGEKAALFGKRLPHVLQNYDMLWEKWIEKFMALGKEMQNLKVRRRASQSTYRTRIFFP